MLVFKVGVYFLSHQQIYEGCSHFASMPTFLILAILVDVLWNVIVILICSSQMINEVEHILYANRPSVHFCIQIFAHLKIGLSYYYLIVRVIYIF